MFTRNEYKDIVVQNLIYCRSNKGLLIYAWVLMTNHLHLIVGRNGTMDIENIIRDFKKYTAVKITRAIEQNPLESRRHWILPLFREAALKSNKHVRCKFWTEGFHPIELNTNYLIDQKLDYIHMNPVKTGVVNEPESYKYSSAVDYAGGTGMIELCYLT